MVPRRSVVKRYIKHKKTNKRNALNKRTKRFRGGSWPFSSTKVEPYNATNVVNPDEVDGERASMETYSGDHYAQKGETMANGERVAWAQEQNIKNMPGIPPSSIIGGLAGMLAVGIGVYFLAESVGKKH